MNSEVIKGMIAGIIRAGLMTVFGGLIAKGYVTESNVLLASGVIAGGALVVLSSIWNKVKVKYKIEAASELPSRATPTQIQNLATANINEALPIAKVLP